MATKVARSFASSPPRLLRPQPLQCLYRRAYSTSPNPTAASIAAECRKVICIGRNYADHIKELNNTRPSSPFFFLKPPSSLLLPNAGPVLRPKGVTMHYEVELGLLIGSSLSNLSATDEAGAFNAISHYLLAIDMTARNVQDSAKKAGLPWTIGKGFDTFCPISEPVPKAALSPNKLDEVYESEVWLDVNGEQRQRDKAELMLFRIPRILSEISGVMRLNPGDIVLTGTPKGVGEVRSGDVMTAGLRYGGKEVEALSMRVDVRDRESGYAFGGA